MHLYFWIKIFVSIFFLFRNVALLTVQPFNLMGSLTKGQTATVLCAVLEGNGPFVFRWTKDGSPLTNHPLTEVENKKLVSLLTLHSLDRSRSGNYTCTVTNDVSQGNFSAEIIVHESPEWLQIPEDVSVVLGQTALIDCKATGFPEPITSWKRFQNPHELIDIDSRKIVNQSTLYLMNIQEEQAGQYQCIISNGIGEALTKVINVKVYVPPQFRDDFQLMRVRSSHSTALQCEVTGDRPLAVKWSMEHMTDEIESRHKIQETPLPNGLLSELFIPRVSRTDAGLYVCRASNPYGEKERTVKVVVLEPPSPPTEIVVKQIGSDEVTIRWSTPYSGNSPVIQYILQYWKDTGSAPKLEEETAASDRTTAVLAGLHPGTPYVVRLMAENEFGQSTPSIPIKFITAEESPSGYPTDISVTSKGANSLLISWKSPALEQRNGLIRGYDLGYRNQRTSNPFFFKEVQVSSQETNPFHQHILDKLEAATEYEIVLRAYNSAGRGPLSVPVSSNTRDKGILNAPVLWAESTSATTISIKWQKFDVKDETSEYRIHYRAEDNPWDEIAIPDINQDSYLLTDLYENTAYEIFLQVLSSKDGRSHPSSTLKVRTADPSSLRSSMARDDETEASSFSDGTAATLVISLSVVTSAVLIVCVVSGACVYVVRIRTRAQCKVEELGSRHLTEHHRSASESTRMSNFRYVDVNSRPLLWCSTPAPPPANDYPSPYATLPLRCTPLAKRWQSEGDEGLSPAQSERSESLINQRVEQPSEKTPSSNDG